MCGRGLKAERRFLHIVTSSFDSIAAHVGAGGLTPPLKSTQIFLSDRTDGSTRTPDAQYLMPEAQTAPDEQSCQKFLYCPPKTSVWVNISPTMLTRPYEPHV